MLFGHSAREEKVSRQGQMRVDQNFKRMEHVLKGDPPSGLFCRAVWVQGHYGEVEVAMSLEGHWFPPEKEVIDCLMALDQ